MDSSIQPAMRIRDAKSSVLYKYSSGVILTATGLTLAIHAYWHGLEPQMLLFGAFCLIVGLYLTYRGQQEAIEKYHAMTRAFFPQT